MKLWFVRDDFAGDKAEFDSEAEARRYMEARLDGYRTDAEVDEWPPDGGYLYYGEIKGVAVFDESTRQPSEDPQADDYIDMHIVAPGGEEAKPVRPPLYCPECGKPGVVVSRIDGGGYYWRCGKPEPCWIGPDGATEAEAYDKAAAVLRATERVREAAALIREYLIVSDGTIMDEYRLKAYDDICDDAKRWLRELEADDAT